MSFQLCRVRPWIFLYCLDVVPVLKLHPNCQDSWPLRSVYTTVSIHKSNLSFARGGQLEDLKCWPGLQHGPHWGGYSAPSRRPSSWWGGGLLLPPKNPTDLILGLGLWTSLPCPHQFFSGIASFVFLKICLVLDHVHVIWYRSIWLTLLKSIGFSEGV